MLKTRILTVLFLLPIVCLAIFFLPTPYFALALAVLIAIGAWEWSSMIGFDRVLFRWIYVVVVVLGLFLATKLPLVVPLLTGFIFWIWITAGILSYQHNGLACGFYQPVVRSLVGFVILVACWVAMLTLIGDANFGPAWLMFVLMLVWAADIGAYFSGRSFGKRALVSRVSPKKNMGRFCWWYGGVSFCRNYWRHIFSPFSVSIRDPVSHICFYSIIFSDWRFRC